MLWWLVGWGCISETPDWSTEFQANPAVVREKLISEPDGIVRLRVVNQLQSEFPGQVGELCTVLESAAQAYCLEKEKRPHLWMPLKESVPIHQRDTVVKEGCSEVSCRIEKALPLALRGIVEQVDVICQGANNSETHECLFMTAERMVEQRGVSKYDTAAEICRLAQSFHENCQNHLIQQLAKKAPDADTVSDWSVIFSAHRAIQTTWGWRDSDLQLRLQSRLWSEALGFAFAGADSIVGNTLDVVPDVYHHHVYSAAAWRLFQLEESQKYSLQVWQETLMGRLQQRTKKAESLDQQRRFRAASTMGSISDTEWPATVYLSTASRWYDERVSVDIVLAILEAASRHPPVNDQLLLDGTHHVEPIVRQTAERLQRVLSNVEP